MAVRVLFLFLPLLFFFELYEGILMFLDGFFDAGMLLQALKARNETLDGEVKPSEKAAGNARRREIGKKLRLSEY